MAKMISVSDMPVSTLESDEVVRISPRASLREAAQVMSESEVGLPVVSRDNHSVLGVVSERDLVRAIAAGFDPDTTFAVDIAHTEVISAHLKSSVSEVAEEMMERYVRHVLIEDAGRVVGVVSARDLLGAYASMDAFPE